MGQDIKMIFVMHKTYANRHLLKSKCYKILLISKMLESIDFRLFAAFLCIFAL